MILRRSYSLIFIWLTFLCLPVKVFSQNTKNILVLPYDRFEFYTDIELTKLNEINNLSGDQLYGKMIESLGEAFELNENPRIFYKVVTRQDMQKIRPYIKYGKEGGKSHYASNLSNLDDQVYAELLNGYDCDYFLTINWYQIIKDRTSYKKKKVKKIALYSYHYIDIDLYSKNKKRLMYIGEARFKVPANEENLQYLGCRLVDLKPEYKKLVDEISKRILSGK